MTTNGSSNDDDEKEPQTERVEVRRVEVEDDRGRPMHVSIHHAYDLRGRRARLHLGWRIWLFLMIAGLVVVGLVALALTVLFYLLPVIVVVVLVLLVARWMQRLFGGRR